MALDFPTNPTDGQVYDNFTYNSSKGIWKSLSSGASPSILVNPTITNAIITATATNSGTTPITVNGAASQSANLQEWKNSSGTTLTSINSSGNIIAPEATFTGLNLNRVNSVEEGGQINFNRASDNANYWFIDTFGSTSTPSLRFIAGSQTNLQLDGGGRVTMPFQPRFQAYGASGSSGTSSQDWIFPSTYVNAGSHYNTSNGRFTAPISGTYIFFWSNIGNTPNTVYRYLLIKNGTGIDDLHLRLGEGITGYRDSGDKKAMINLAAGDYVNIKFISDNGTASYTSGQYPWFGGYLLA